MAQVGDLATLALSARVTFQTAAETDRLEVLNSVLGYLDVADGKVAS
jgi:hypothetical protein